jgi:hypothetical protein
MFVKTNQIMRLLRIFLICTISFPLFAKAGKKDENQIQHMLEQQVTGWNNGKLEEFMNGYWENDSLVFIGKNGPTYGYSATLARYKKSYADPEAMGHLKSTILSMKRLSGKYYFITGKWELTRTAGNLSGYYTLLIKKIKGKWVIVNDHSS